MNPVRDPALHPAAWLHGAVWPQEFQQPRVFTRKGHITNWDFSPEFLEGDFFDLKNIHLGSGEVDHYQPTDALKALAEVYKFWIAFACLAGLFCRYCFCTPFRGRQKNGRALKSRGPDPPMSREKENTSDY